ncbi:MAG: hypothetical protein UIH27_17290 [Ruminococcus sp.]|nr:hypothetical protein [Ruminococcus sp.]
MKRNIKLYNMVFPMYFLLHLEPLYWVCIVAANFLIDSAVLLLGTRLLYKRFRLDIWKTSVIPVVAVGFLADFLGFIYLVTTSMAVNPTYQQAGDSLIKQIENGIYFAVNHSYTDSVFGVLFMLSGIFVSALFIFSFNYVIVLRMSVAEKKNRLILSLFLAVLTAPYTFLIP